MELFNSINEFISPKLVQDISKDFKEDESKILSAIQTTIASILEILIEKKENKKFILLLKYAGSSGLLFNFSDLFSDKICTQNKKIVSKFIQYLFQDKKDKFINIISLDSGLSKENAKKIIFRIILLCAAFIGESLLSGINFSVLKNHIEDERFNFQQYIPIEMNSLVDKLKSFSTYKLWSSLF
ncbi:DUF937 domain-containing protein [Apibacter adventoris]|uniref:DUF937 domain-containing protein n=1 Tax=Apibacter adventoris TaxID=1679466 RepID=UPI000CF5E4EB|nr:DUF937 domain-containing protein [Apibacter adventoris]PQL94685.1 hypothetical protein C4S76_04430 [Apibacter adventoris]